MPVDGLVSGLDTQSIIKSLMAIERAPQDAMVLRQKKAQSAIDAFSAIRTKLDAASAAAAKLATATKWNAMTATTNVDGVVRVSTTDSAVPLVLSFTVDQLATQHAARSVDTIASLDTVVASSGTVSIDTGTGPQSLTVGDGRLSDVIAALNASGTGVVASAVDTGSGFRLQVASMTTGAGSAFVLGGLDDIGGMVTAIVGKDAQLTIGEGAGAYSVTSANNSFKNLAPGVTLEAKSVSAEPVTLTVSPDTETLTTRTKEFIDSVNSALNEARKYSATKGDPKTAGVLAGDPAVRRIIQDLTTALTEAVPGSAIGSAAEVGIKLDRSGQFSIDTEKFKAALAKDSPGVVSFFADSGIAHRAATAITNATNRSEGYLSGASESRKTNIDSLEKSIRDYDRRLDVREKRLRAYWSKLEVSLGNIQQQNSWLAGQIAGLNANKG